MCICVYVFYTAQKAQDKYNTRAACLCDKTITYTSGQLNTVYSVSVIIYTHYKAEHHRKLCLLSFLSLAQCFTTILNFLVHPFYLTHKCDYVCDSTSTATSHSIIDITTFTATAVQYLLQ